MSLRLGSLVGRAGKTLKIASLMRDARQFFFQDEYIRLKSARVSQVMLSVLYKDLLSRRAPLPGFEDIEFRAFSQNGEDVLPEVLVSTCFEHPYTQHAMEVRRLKIAHREWVEV